MALPAPARLVSLAGQVQGLVWEEPGTAEPERPRLRAQGQLVPPPLALTALPLAGGGVRRLVTTLARTGEDSTLEVVDRHGRVLARTNGERLADPLHLLDRLSGEGRARFARLLLATAPSLFGVGDDPAWARLAHEVAAELSREPRPLVARCRLPGGLVLAETLAAGLDPTAPEALVVTGTGLARAAIAAIASDPRVASLALRLDDALLARGATLALPGAAGLLVTTLAPRPSALPGLRRWLAGGEARTGGRKERALDVLALLAADRAEAAALLRELRLAPATPGSGLPLRATVQAAFGSAHGALAWFTLDDPHGLVTALRLQRPGLVQDIPRERWTELPSPAGGDGVPGRRFAVHDRRATRLPLEAPCRPALLTTAGSVVPLAEPAAFVDRVAARAWLLGEATGLAAQPRLLEAVVAPALAALEPAPGGAEAAIAALGAAPKRPAVSLIVPLGPDSDLERCRTSALALDPGLRDAEFLHVAADPADPAAVLGFLAAMRDLHGIATRLIVVRGAPLGEAVATALRLARAPRVALLGETAIPEGPGWLRPMTAVLARQRRCAAVGGVLCAADGTLLEGGQAVAADPWAEPERGFPRAWWAGRRATTSPRLAGGALLVDRARLPAELTPRIAPMRSSAGLARALGLACREAGAVLGTTPVAFAALGPAAGGPDGTLRLALDRLALARRIAPAGVAIEPARLPRRRAASSRLRDEAA
jgi:hypothetical protein